MERICVERGVGMAGGQSQAARTILEALGRKMLPGWPKPLNVSARFFKAVKKL